MQITRKNLNRLISEEYAKILKEDDQERADELDPALLEVAQRMAKRHAEALKSAVGHAVYDITFRCTNSGNQSSTSDMYSAACVVIERMVAGIFDVQRAKIVSELSDELKGSS